MGIEALLDEPALQRLSAMKRLLLVGMVALSDQAGEGPADGRFLSARVFACAGRAAGDRRCAEWMKQLQQVTLLDGQPAVTVEPRTGSPVYRLHRALRRWDGPWGPTEGRGVAQPLDGRGGRGDALPGDPVDERGDARPSTDVGHDAQAAGQGVSNLLITARRSHGDRHTVGGSVGGYVGGGVGAPSMDARGRAEGREVSEGMESLSGGIVSEGREAVRHEAVSPRAPAPAPPSSLPAPPGPSAATASAAAAGTPSPQRPSPPLPAPPGGAGAGARGEQQQAEDLDVSQIGLPEEALAAERARLEDAIDPFTDQDLRVWERLVWAADWDNGALLALRRLVTTTRAKARENGIERARAYFFKAIGHRGKLLEEHGRT